MSKENTVKKRLLLDRFFQGNENYVRLFNAHLKQDKVDLDDAGYSGSYQIDHVSKCVGTEWEDEDKELFFHLLSRYSIHRLDIIANKMQRNEQDIYNYYRTLRKALKRWKRDPNRFHELMKMDEFPIAYEMSESYIKMENKQLDCLADLDEKEYEQQIVPKPVNEDKLINEQNVLNLLLFYDLQILNPSVYSEVVPHELCSYLEDIVKLYVRKILLDLVTNRYMYKKMTMQNLHENADGDIPIAIRHSEILHSVQKCLPGNITKLKDFWSNFAEDHNINDISSVKTCSTHLTRENPDFFHDLNHVLKKLVKRKRIEDVESPMHEKKKTKVKLEDLIFIQESKLLNDKDLKESRHHEHVVLTFLSTELDSEVETPDNPGDPEEDEPVEEPPQVDFYEDIKTKTTATDDMVTLSLYNFASYKR